MEISFMASSQADLQTQSYPTAFEKLNNAFRSRASQTNINSLKC